MLKEINITTTLNEYNYNTSRPMMSHHEMLTEKQQSNKV